MRRQAIARAGLLATLLVLARASGASATTLTFVRDERPAVDPLEGFEADCLGATEAPDCPLRAALLADEMVELLALESVSDPEQIAIFTSIVGLEDPRLQNVALSFLARVRMPPVTLWEKVKAFFFGPDPRLGHPSAQILGRSAEAADQALSRAYLDGRPANYGGTRPEGAGATDSWANGVAKDMLLDAVAAFSVEERFATATRLLMRDRFITSTRDPMAKVPVSAFVTDVSAPEVIAHFTKVFGREPHPSLTNARARLQSLMAELAMLQQQVLAGDPATIKRLQMVSMEMLAVQESIAMAGILTLDALGCAEHTFWADGSSKTSFSGPLPRGVTVGTDPLIARTVIRYISGAEGGGGAAPPRVGPDAAAPTGREDAGAQDGSADAVPPGAAPDQSDESGCNCAMGAAAGAPPGELALIALALGAFSLRRRRKTREGAAFHASST